MNYIRVLGSANWHQTAFNDHSCYTVSDRLLIDACPTVVAQLLEQGVDPVEIPVLCFTHMHCDHIMGLPPLLHYWHACRNRRLGALTILGPKETLRETIDRALVFMYGTQEEIDFSIQEMPRIIELEGDSALDLQGYHIEVMKVRHAVPGLAYRITDTASGKVVGFTGDTAYLPAFGSFFRDTDLLLHEASYGAGPVNHPNPAGHSGAAEAARVCMEAKVRRLLLTHAYEPNREAALAEARRRLTIPVDWALPHHVFSY